MREVFARHRWHVATLAGVVSLLVVAYGIVPHRLVQYGAWLVIFTVWMAWFIYTGVDYIYGVEAGPEPDADS